MRALVALPAPMAGVPVTPAGGNVAARVWPQCVTGRSGAMAYTVLLMPPSERRTPPSIVTIRSPLGCTASPDTATPARVCCHSRRVARAAVALDAAWDAAVPPYATAVSCAWMVTCSIPAGTLPTVVPASKVDAPVWKALPASFRTTSIENGQLNDPGAHPSGRDVPSET